MYTVYITIYIYVTTYITNYITICVGWFLLCAFIVANYFRMYMRIDAYNCSTVSEVQDHYICQIENSTTLFVVTGFGLFVVTFITYIMTIVYIWRLMATKGIVSKSDFPTFLQLLESNDNLDADATKLSLDEITVS